jgi:hypothetical protein
MKTFKILLLVSIFLPSVIVTAEIGYCDQKAGTTVVFVNGILSPSEESSALDKELIKTLYFEKYGNAQTSFELGHNPSRGVVFDMVKSIFQSFQLRGYVLDSDMYTIIESLKDKVTTDKIVLVGHSQGTFYTNNLFEYLTVHSVPYESVAVYNIATPASYVAGGGFYYTSTTDKLINMARSDQKVMSFGKKYALPGNFTIPLTAEEDQKLWGGHGLRDVYLANASGIIMSDIHDAVELVESGAPREACIPQPVKIVASIAQGVRFALNVSSKTLAILFTPVTAPYKEVTSIFLANAMNAVTPFDPSSIKTNIPATPSPTVVTVKVAPTKKVDPPKPIPIQSASVMTPIIETPVVQTQTIAATPSSIQTQSSPLPQPLTFGAGMGGGGAPLVIEEKKSEPEKILASVPELPEIVPPTISISTNACLRVDPCVVPAGDVVFDVVVNGAEVSGVTNGKLTVPVDPGEQTISVTATNAAGEADASITVIAVTDPLHIQYGYILYDEAGRVGVALMLRVHNASEYMFEHIRVTTDFQTFDIPMLQPYDFAVDQDVNSEPRPALFESLTGSESIPYTVRIQVGSADYMFPSGITPFAVPEV